MCPKQGNACDEDVNFSVHLSSAYFYSVKFELYVSFLCAGQKSRSFIIFFKLTISRRLMTSTYGCLFHTCKLHVDTLYPREQETRTLKHYFHTSYRDY